MLSKIPHKLPFGLLGDEAKLAFRSQSEGISKLATSRRISERSTYWEQYFTLFDSASDVFSLILPHDIRRALHDAPENVATLLRLLIVRLVNLVSDHTFPSAMPATVASFASAFVKSGGGERNTTKEALNSIRVLQRVLPVVFEMDSGSESLEMDVLWKSETIDAALSKTSRPTSPQFVIDDEDEDEDERSAAPQENASLRAREPRSLPSLAEQLLDSIVDLLFCCGFTLPTHIQEDHHKINHTIWEKGIGSTLNLAANPTLDSHKVEVLRLLLVVLSRQIYVAPNLLLAKTSLYSLHFVQRVPRRHVLTLLCSLINTALTFHSGGANIIGGMRLPYDHLVFKGEDSRTTLIATSFQVLCALLDFQSGAARDVVTKETDKENCAPTAHTNAFRYFLAKLHRAQDFAFVLDGVTDVLETQMASIGGLLPGSRKPISYAVECVLFIWKLLEINQRFRIYVLNSAKAVNLISCLLVFCLELKEKPREQGVCRAISHILQTLSAESSFALTLCSPVSSKVPARWVLPGTMGDFLVNSVYLMVATTSGSLNASYPALVITLSNAAPHFRNLNIAASARLLQLYTSFSKPLFLLSDERHPRLLYFILEVFNGVIAHHLAENPHLIYAILCAHQSFESLSTFTLSQGLRDIINARDPQEEPKGDVGLVEAVDSSIQKVKRSPPGSAVGSNLGLQPTHSPLEGAELTATGHQRPILTQPPPQPMSEYVGSADPSKKALGKMKARRSPSLDTMLNDALSSLSGRNGFIPTQEWVTSWQQGLPLDPIMILISEVLPKVREIHALRSKTKSTSAVVDYLSGVSLDTVIPRLPISPRQFIWTDASIVWLTSLMWGEIYVHNISPLGIWAFTSVRLFHVKQNQQRALVGSVSDVVGGLLGRSTSDSG